MTHLCQLSQKHKYLKTWQFALVAVKLSDSISCKYIVPFTYKYIQRYVEIDGKRRCETHTTKCL